MESQTLNRNGLAVVALLAILCVDAQTKPPTVNTPDVVPSPPIRLPLKQNGVLPEGPLSVDAAVKVALESSPTVMIARQVYAQSKGATKSSAAPLKPQVTLTASDTQGSNPQVGGGSTGSAGTGWNSSASATLSQLLFDFGKSKSSHDAARKFELMAGQQLRQAEASVSKTVRFAYITFQLDTRLARTAQSNLDNRNRQLELSTARLQAGIGAPSEVVQAKTALAAAAVSLNTARATADLAHAALAVAMGIDPQSGFTTTDDDLQVQSSESAAVPNADQLDQTVKMAIEHRPEILAGRFQVEAAKSGLESARRLGGPALALTGALSSRGVGPPFTSQNSTVGLNLSWIPVDGGTRAGNVESARALVAQAEAVLAQTSLGVSNDVYQAVVNKLTAEQNVATASIQVANAVEFLRISEGRYRGGVGLFTDTVTAADASYVAQNSYAQSVASLHLAEVNYKWAIGEL